MLTEDLPSLRSKDFLMLSERIMVLLERRRKWLLSRQETILGGPLRYGLHEGKRCYFNTQYMPDRYWVLMTTKYDKLTYSAHYIND